MHIERLAFDKASVRRLDQDGRLHVAVSHISKANVCPYRGAEIPDGVELLGLKPDAVYQMLRAPEELARGAATFNNIPILTRHVPVSAEDPKPELVVGSTGTDAAFIDPYLDNSLVIWDQTAIDGINSEQQRELSCAYHYRPDMTPGVFAGVKYDGVMRDLRGNHVALVEAGRAGDDVVVGDAAFVPAEPDEQATSSPLENNMQQKKVTLSPRAAVAKGMMIAALTPKLAQDQKLPDIGRILAGTGSKNWKERKAGIAAQIVTSMKGRLAQDADLADVVQLLDKLDPSAGGDRPEDAMVGVDDVIPQMGAEIAPDDAGGDDIAAKVKAMLTGKVDDATLSALLELLAPAAAAKPVDTGAVIGDDGNKITNMGGKDPNSGAEGGGKDPAKDGDPAMKPVTQPAMDAAIAKAAKDAEARTVQRMNAIREAEKAVRPYIGELTMAMDSADDIYRLALTGCNVDIDGVPPEAYPAMLKLVPIPGSADAKPRGRMAFDAKAVSDFTSRYGADAARIRNLG